MIVIYDEGAKSKVLDLWKNTCFNETGAVLKAHSLLLGIKALVSLLMCHLLVLKKPVFPGE